MKITKSASKPKELQASPELLRSNIDTHLQKYHSAIGDVRNTLLAVKQAKEQKPFELKLIHSLKSSRYFRFFRFKSK